MTLNLNNIVSIAEYVTPMSAPRSTFNQLLIIGTGGVIDTTERLREYTSADALLEDGFANDSLEYLAAIKYFSQRPAPTKLWVGCKSVSPAETFLQAITDCRAKNPAWYVGICLGAIKSDHVAIAEWVEAAIPSSVYAYTTADSDCITPAETDIGTELKDDGYRRSIGQYSTDQLAMVAIMGYAMGANTGLANSAYTLKFKGQVGIAVMDITQTQLGYLNSKNLNCYVNYGNYYNIFTEGVMADGTFFDEVLNLDMLRNDVQLNVMDLLYQNPKIPQTDPGQLQFLLACNQACDLAVNRGFVASGKWNGVQILNLNYGDILTRGYICQSESYSEQSQADRDARKAMPIYIAIKLAGAVHSIVIGVYVNR